MTSVLFVEASSGGVLGGSLTGLYHLIRGMDRDRFRIGMALYEAKVIEDELAEMAVRVHHVPRRRLPKQHALLELNGYQKVRAAAARAGIGAGRQTARLLAEEVPAALALARVIRREQPDVIHLGNGLRANFDGILAGLLTRRPIICHVKGFEKYTARERWGARRTTTLVCMTRAVLDHCHAHGMHAPNERVVYDAVDEAWLQPGRPADAVRRDLGIPIDAPCIGIAGNIQEWKGQHVVVEALGRLPDHPTVHCVVAGGVHRAGEAYAVELRARIGSLGLAHRVHLLGFRADIPDVMNAWDAVVHASVRPEPFGRVILEGMLLGKPVIATAAGGVPELIDDQRTGFLVPPGNAAALAEAIRRVLEAPAEAQAIGARARAWARQNFSLARQVAEMSEIYEGAAGTH
jgi:glycosyltransferase involved in cell wall biosynthesis